MKDPKIDSDVIRNCVNALLIQIFLKNNYFYLLFIYSFCSYINICKIYFKNEKKIVHLISF